MKLVPYQAPKWFLDHPLVQKHLTSVVSKIPSHRIELLSKRPTPIERVQQLTSPQYSVPAEYELSIKRDDLTHTEPHLQGNKLRKLEFVFADVLAKKAQNVLTAGGLQSNHCRTVASVCARLGLRSHLFLRSPYPDATKIDLNGNMLVDLMLGSKIYLIERVAQYYESIEAKMNILASKLDSPSYLIPIGASNIVGLWGYIDMFDELISVQKADELYDDICVTAGSGGTMSGLAIANYLSGSKFRLHAFCVCDSSAYFYSHLEDILKELFGSDDIPNPREIVDIIECSKGLGYGKSTDDELKFQIEFLKSNGIMLDPVYTGKMVYTAYNLLGGRKPTLEYDKESDFVKKLSGKRILLVHTGGHLANFEAKRFESVFKDRENFFDCFGEKIDLV